MGMEHPFHLVMPKEYIEGIRKMNGGRTQMPSSWLASMDPNAARQQAGQIATARRQAQEQVASEPQQPPAVQQQAAPTQQQAAPTQQQSAPAANNARRQRAAGTQASARQQEVPSYAAVH
jgi:hypothetical protein